MDIRAGDEGFVTRAGDYGGAQFVVLRQAIESRGDGALAFHAQYVAAGRIVDGDIGDTACVAALVDTGEYEFAHFITDRTVSNACSWVTVGATN